MLQRKQWFAIGMVLISTFAVVAQLYLMLNNRVESLPETLIRFFSFFTILTNTLVAAMFISLWLLPKYHFFQSVRTQTAITVYILVVGLVYNTVLRFIWQPEGLQKLVDELLHTVIPVTTFVFWWFYTNSKTLVYRAIFPWLIYPFLYLLTVLARGHISGFYPYPFVDVTQLGYPKVVVNSLWVVLVFVSIAVLLVKLSKHKPVQPT
uniref:Pr6Pr family membrane protein n=1 Tax=Gelidibacter sp. TaxID=2018083 RepID=UPI0040490386